MNQTADLPATLAEHKQRAKSALDNATWAYLSGGAGDEITLHENQRAWQNIRLRPRVLRQVAGGHTRTALLGSHWPTPLLVAPMAYQCLAHPHAESGMAMAAAAQGAGMVLSAQSSETLEAVAQRVVHEADRGPLWFQLYWQAQPELNQQLIRRAENAGYEALVLTVDAPIQGVRDAERRNGFVLPASVRAVNLENASSPSLPALRPGQSAVFDGLMHHAPHWDSVADICRSTHLPVLLKGVTHPDDAQMAIAHGAAGLIVSNHGGRILDTMAATADVLSDVVNAAKGAVPVLVDGGIRRGSDVFKALALGASAVLIGRPVLWGLASAGAPGAAHVLRLLRDELEATMALCGCQTVLDVREDRLLKYNEIYSHLEK